MNPWIRPILFVIAGLFTLTSPLQSALLWLEGINPADPFWRYYHLWGVRSIHLTAVVLDFALVACIGFWFALSGEKERDRQRRIETGIFAVSLFLSSLPWVELWYGAVSYYGEVRDKQGLPWTVNHWGPVGSFVFLTLGVWALPSEHNSQFRQMGVRIVLTVLVLCIVLVLTKILEQPWDYQSS